MATKLVKPVSREVEITDAFDNAGECIITMKTDGIELRRKGTQRKFFIAWKDMGKSIKSFPGHMPSRHAANPLGWLTQK